MSEPPAYVPTRHGGRERAMSFLYEAETRECSVQDLLDQLPMAADEFAVDLALGAEAHQAEIDEMLADHAHRWTLGRMARVDRAILRLASYELGHRPDIPTAVVLDEAVELAKEYSTEKSAPFVNGVLVAVADEVRPG